MQYLGAISKTTEWSPFVSKANHSRGIQVCAPTSYAEETEVERFYEDLQDLSELIPKKDVLFIIRDWNAKVGSQETPGVTGKFGLGIWNEAGQRLIEFCQENALVIVNTLFQQHKRKLYTWISPDGQHWNQIDYILWSQRWRSSIWSMNYALCLKNMDGGLWHCIGDREQDHPQEKEIQKSKMAVWEGLTKHHYKQS